MLISNQKEFQNLRLQGEKTNELKALINLKSSILCSCASSDCHIGLHIGCCKQQKSGTNKTCSRIKMASKITNLSHFFSTSHLLGKWYFNGGDWKLKCSTGHLVSLFFPAPLSERMSTEFHFHLDELKWYTLRCFNSTYRALKAKFQHVVVHIKMAWKRFRSWFPSQFLNNNVFHNFWQSILQ